MRKKFVFTVNEKEAGQRLDKALILHFKGYTRQYIQKLIDGGEVRVNLKNVKASYKVKKGERINICFPEPEKLDVLPVKIPIEIIFEDKNLLIINKPTGMVVHPGTGNTHSTDSLVNAVLYHCKGSLSGIGGVRRPGIVHRLDKDTSGLLVVAKNDKTHQYLMNLFKDRKVEKTYFALIKGNLEPEKGTIDAPIGRDGGDRKKMAISNNGREAVTKYKVIKYFKDCTFVEIKLITGRTHQIRVHFNSIGYPLVGDPIYGRLKLNKLFEREYGLSRLFLHAGRISFIMPGKKKPKSFEAPLPLELKKVLNLLSR